MSTTEVVAIIGAGSTLGVAVAGYAFNYFTAGRLARDAHQHERELADAAQAHERQLRQGERAYGDHKTAYRQLLKWMLVSMRQVELTEPLLRVSGMPEPPPNIPEDEHQAMLIEVSAFGSPEVSDALTEYSDKVRSFHLDVDLWRTLQEQHAEPQQTRDSYRKIHPARELARDAFEKLRTLIRDELANL